MPEDINSEEETALGPEASATSTKKVELDLDDAPFLQTEEKAPPPAPVNSEPPVPEDGQSKKSKKKLLIIIGAAALVIIGVAVWFFFFRTPPPPPPPGPEPEVIVVPSTAAPAQPGDLVREFAPFVVPVNDDPRHTSFLVCKFAAITRDPAVNQEMDQQALPLRDAIYFYLRGKDAAFLSDARNGAEIKKDLLSVFNDYLSQGKLEDIVFESYLTR